METARTPASPAAIDAVVVIHQSASVIEDCLTSLAASAPRRGIRVHVIDNASTDDGPERAEGLLPPGAVVRTGRNAGFASGVNAVLAGFTGAWLAVINPDVLMPSGALDALADALEREPRAALAAPRVVRPGGGEEDSVGWFPDLAHEWAHAWLLGRLGWRPGRHRRFPERTGPVDWASGCAWLLRGAAIREVGSLDEGYFMYFEDVDYCHRLADANWQVLAVREVAVTHAGGRGSTGSSRLPADGGEAPLLRYFHKFQPDTPPDRVVSVLRQGWRVRLMLHRLRSWAGDPHSRSVSTRYERALHGTPADAARVVSTTSSRESHR